MPTGYVVCKSVWGDGVYASEVVARTEEIRRAVLAFMVEKNREHFPAELEFRLALDDPYAFFLQDFGSRIVSQYFAEGQGNAMLRLINLPSFLKDIKPVLESRLNASPLKSSRFGINMVTDDAGKATLVFSHGKLSVKVKPDPDLPTLETPQNLLTRSVIGYWDADRLMARVEASGHKVPAEAASLLRILFPPQYPFTTEPDYF